MLEVTVLRVFQRLQNFRGIEPGLFLSGLSATGAAGITSLISLSFDGIVVWITDLLRTSTIQTHLTLAALFALLLAAARFTRRSRSIQSL